MSYKATKNLLILDIVAMYEQLGQQIFGIMDFNFCIQAKFNL
jgi:hypothetical protein